MRQRLAGTIEEEGQKALAAADARLEEYREAQRRDIERLGTLSEDAGRLDAELRRHMRETEDRVLQDFSVFEQNFADTRSSASAEFAAALEALRGDVSSMDREIVRLKEQAYDTVSDKMKLFEEDFLADLFRRREEFELKIGKWKDGLDAELAELGESSRTERRKLEISFGEDLKRHFADEDARLVSDLEHLKAETGAFEEGIRNQIARADESLETLKGQLDASMADARSAADSSVKAELGRFSLAFAETLKQQQREIEGEINKIASQVESRSGEFGALLDESRRDIEEWQNKFSGQMRDLDDSLDERRRKLRDLETENEERLAAVRSSIEKLREETAARRNDAFAHTDEQARILDSAVKDADRRIKEFLAQTKLFSQAEELRSSMERKLEDLRGDLNGLDQRRSEAAELEAKFIRIKRLEEEVDAKMVSFQSDKRRIELMENDFNRLLQTSQSVKEKLAEVTASDDTLQAALIQIRRLEDALADVEDRYQRIEKKNQTLEETNAGIDDNFKALQESDRATQKLQGEIRRLLEEQEGVRSSVEKLFAENARAREAAEKASALDGILSSIETRMEKLQTVRESLAKAETRFEDINKSLQEQYKLFTALLREDGPKPKGPGAPPIGVRENVIKLKQQGWKVEEIAPIVKLSMGEVELILEMGSKV
jgi:DNA repair exonuclease SbcCD ATPase subunit